MVILAIDPGNIDSGYCMMCDNHHPILHGKKENNELLDTTKYWDYDVLVIEMVASYGMAVGATVFDTCVWIGRFIQEAERRGIPFHLVYRKEEKMNLCGRANAKDANIRQALIDRFAKTASGKGTRKEPDFFYGFAADAWMAFAVGVTWIDKQQEEKKHEGIS